MPYFYINPVILFTMPNKRNYTVIAIFGMNRGLYRVFGGTSASYQEAYKRGVRECEMNENVRSILIMSEDTDIVIKRGMLLQSKTVHETKLST